MCLNVLFFFFFFLLSIHISHSLMSLFRLIINCKRGSVSSNAGLCLCSGCSVCSSSLSVSWWEERRDFPTSAPTMYFYIPAYVWLAQPEFRIPKSSQIGITFFLLLFFFFNYKKGGKIVLMQRSPLFKIYSRPSADQKKGHLLHLGSKSGR